MENTPTKAELIRIILNDLDDDIVQEDAMHLLLSKKVSMHENAKNQTTIGQRAADKLAKFVGSWKFIYIFISVLVAWMLTNILFLTNPFDPYPFILLNLALSLVAAIQAPLIMMSQNRQEDIDRLRSENDYKVNLKTELIIEDLHNKIDMLLDRQSILEQMLSSREQNK